MSKSEQGNEAVPENLPHIARDGSLLSQDGERFQRTCQTPIPCRVAGRSEAIIAHALGLLGEPIVFSRHDSAVLHQPAEVLRSATLEVVMPDSTLSEERPIHRRHVPGGHFLTRCEGVERGTARAAPR